MAMQDQASSAAALVAALDRLDRGLGGQGVADIAAAVAALESAAADRAATTARDQAVANQQRAMALRLADALGRSTLAGLRARGGQRSADGAWWTCRFDAQTGGSLEVDLALLPDADGKARPRLQHRAIGMDDATLRAASAAIGAVLRPLLRGRAPDAAARSTAVA